MTITAERAQELLDGATPGPWDVRDCNPGFRVINPHGDAELGTWAVADCWWAQDALMCAAAPDLARTVIAQAAEITRLQAKVDAADVMEDALDEAVRILAMPFGVVYNPDNAIAAGYAALTAYREAGE